MNYLYKNNIFTNITYFPPLGYSEMNKYNISQLQEKNMTFYFMET